MQTLADKIRQIPHKSGIYEYFDSNYRILYIGKAKDLRKRVKNYFILNGELVAPASNLSPRIISMVRQIYDIKTIITDSEQDALILENSLIKQLKPKYNILLRDDKTYPYILVDKSSPFPRLEITRKIINNKSSLYFGPYSSGIKDLLDSIYEIVPLVQKKSCLKSKKACLFHQIGRCYAPCENKISKEKYEILLNEALNLLSNPNKLIKILHSKMQEQSNNLRFEEANIIKNKIEKIKQIATFSVIDLAKLYNFDIFAIVSKDVKSIVIKIFMRDGKVVFSDYYFINHNNNDLDSNYLYTQALINHYKHNPPLKLDSILLPIDLEESSEISDFFKENFKMNIKILNPKSGEKKKLIDLAINNAKNILENNNDDENILYSLKSLLNLENLPKRIEIFDTSHHQGSSIVGGMVVFENNEFIKDSYRKYLLNGKDEYSQMSEMLERRAKKFEVESPPDLWLIDGGIAQINIAKEIIESSGSNVDIVAISKEKLNHKAYRAKGAARDILRTQTLELRLDKFDTRLLFFQKLRDEAHRYAITFHRNKKTKSLKDSKYLDKYSEAELKRLLNYFGSFSGLDSADGALIKSILKNKK
ncbi:MAG: excinuclease ABC subunit UvrC [Helicobacteraceae bacterium]|nr:excinuclease ABC subunit UvrC [Helicobacteraceae bacterium]